MSFTPLLPLSGYAGWVFLDRTMDAQKEALSKGSQNVRETEYFAENISKVRTADDLVGDYRLLKVALGAFGLDDDVGNSYFIRKVLAEGTSSPNAFANKLAEKSYFAMSEAFGLGEGSSPRTGLSGFSDQIIAAYRVRQFEVAVGEQNEDYRLALDTKRELATISTGDLSDDGMWYSVMGSTRLRTVFETAFGLPSSFSSLDLDVQLEVFRDKSRSVFGDGEVRQFSDADRMDELLRTFLLRSELKDLSTGMSSGSIALALLGGS